jgi:hypothetical protein
VAGCFCFGWDLHFLKLIILKGKIKALIAQHDKPKKSYLSTFTKIKIVIPQGIKVIVCIIVMKVQYSPNINVLIKYFMIVSSCICRP